MLTRSKARSELKRVTLATQCDWIEDSQNIEKIFGIVVDIEPQIFDIDDVCRDAASPASAKKRRPCQSQIITNRGRTTTAKKRQPLTQPASRAAGRRKNGNTSNNVVPQPMEIFEDPLVISSRLESPASPPPPQMLDDIMNFRPMVKHTNEFKRPYTYRNRPMQLQIPRWAKYNDDTFDVRLFSKFCQSILSGTCVAENCRRPHQLPSAHTLLPVLQCMDAEEVVGTYNAIVCRSIKLKRMYMAPFAQYFGLHGMRQQLDTIVEHIEHPMFRMYHCYYHIVQGYCRTGLQYTDALKRLMRIRKANDAQSNKTMVMLILETAVRDIVPILDELRVLLTDMECHMDIEIMRKLIAMSVELKNQKLISIVWAALKRNHGMANRLQFERNYQKLRALTTIL